MTELQCTNWLNRPFPLVVGVGYVDLSEELSRPRGFKCLSWWREEGGLIHAFLSVGIVAEPLMISNRTPWVVLSETLPWLDLEIIAEGKIKPMEVFADNSLDCCIWTDFAGVYLGSSRAFQHESSESTALRLLNESPLDLRGSVEGHLWGLWNIAPYAYTSDVDEGDRCVKSGHQLTFSEERTILTAKSVTLL